MRIIDSINELKVIIRSQKSAGKTIGFVPTMGYLHEGHLSLARASIAENDFTVMSIFVNPAQFGPNEDFERYPRDIKGDSAKAENCGVDVLFAPPSKEMYPEGYSTFVEVTGKMAGKLCGKSRPGHFRGVTTVVLKLLNIVEPDRAYFGQKDAQQAAIVSRMAMDLNVNTKIIVCPIVREADGLAMSSRNVYLNSEERKAALALSASLFDARDRIMGGERNAEKVRTVIIERIGKERLARIEYVSVVDAGSFKDVGQISGKVLIALAVWFGNTRLIDNIIVEV